MPSSSIRREAKLKSVSRMERALDLPGDLEAGQDFFQDVRNAEVLEDAALGTAAQQPELRHHLQPVVGEDDVPSNLTDLATDPAPVPLAVIGKLQTDGDAVAEQLVEGHLLRILGQEVESEVERSREAFFAMHAREQQGVRRQRREDGDRPVGLEIGGHQSIWYRKPPLSPTPTCTREMVASEAMRARYSREISGRSVRVRMWSTFRAPDSTSVHRRAISATRAS